jgi:stage V sporulation protein S
MILLSWKTISAMKSILIGNTACIWVEILVLLICESSLNDISPVKQRLSMVHKERETKMDVIKVKATSRTAAVAGAIAGVMRENKHAEVQAIGAGAVNQAIKALVLAKGYLADDNIPIVCIPEFVDVDIDGKVRTAVKLVVETR